MKTTGIYFDTFEEAGATEMLEEVRYDEPVKLTGYKFKKHLWYSFVIELKFSKDGSLYMTLDNELLFSAIIENGKATVYLFRNGKSYEYRTFKVR